MNETTSIRPFTITEKLDWLENRYWKFGQDDTLADHLHDLYEVDDEGQMTAQPRRDPLTGETKGLMVLGGSGNGKTALLMRTLRADPVLTEFKVDKPGNTLFITVPPEATIKKLAEIILQQTGYAKVDTKLRAADAWEIARHRFGMVGINTVVIDECHHILRSGPGRDVLAAIQSLKHIMQSERGVALVIAGVPSLRDAILSEPSGETYRRFREFHLSRISPGSTAARRFGQNFLKSAEVLGVQVCEEDAVAERILFAEHGQVGRSVALGKEILRDAVTRKREVLSLEFSERVFQKSNPNFGMTPFHPGAWVAVKKELEAIGWGA
ncbi:TniB family NTP-binding protein [Defluviimonas sp. WL0024]|uniref:TniB family NTP-binding protein n=1 Tax=Albidovulum salinarum TaxID=2984153 RepID=A0ABT2X1K1_9RHOB|nr:TniB family NTP-binding protein [Defluviimonas sp. WL0024]MCU9847816.1 TniB family NTP-binding protein [Defluviimonas sp. WL0024]